MTQGMGGVDVGSVVAAAARGGEEGDAGGGWLGRGGGAREDASGTGDDDDGTRGRATTKKEREGRYERVNPMNYASVNDTTKLLVCGGIAGAFSKSCTAPLARLTILNQLQGTNAVPGWEGRGGASVDRELAATDRRHGGSDGALEGERGDHHTSPTVQRRQLLRVRANHERVR